MKANKYMIMICLLLLGMSGKVLAQKGNTGDVRIAGKSVRKVDSLLQINLKIDLTGLTVKSNLAVDIIPVLSGMDAQTLRLPKLLVTGRIRHIVFQRMPETETAGQREMRRYNKEEQYADYMHSLRAVDGTRGLVSRTRSVRLRMGGGGETHGTCYVTRFQRAGFRTADGLHCSGVRGGETA